MSYREKLARPKLLAVRILEAVLVMGDVMGPVRRSQARHRSLKISREQGNLKETMAHLKVFYLAISGQGLVKS